MLGRFPYSSMQEINLDWILSKVRNILRFVPDDGAVGQVLRRTQHGAEWSDEQGAGGSVTSVNGMQGAVVLDAADVGALPDTTVIPDSTSDLINDSGYVDAAGAAAAAPVQSVNGQTGNVVISAGAGWDTPQTVTLPFTPTKDGFVVGLMAPNTSANSWMYINDDGSQYARAMSSGGTGYGMSFPVITSHSYTIANSGNIASSKFTYIPFK